MLLIIVLIFKQLIARVFLSRFYIHWYVFYADKHNRMFNLFTIIRLVFSLIAISYRLEISLFIQCFKNTHTQKENKSLFVFAKLIYFYYQFLFCMYDTFPEICMQIF